MGLIMHLPDVGKSLTVSAFAYSTHGDAVRWARWAAAHQNFGWLSHKAGVLPDLGLFVPGYDPSANFAVWRFGVK